MTPAQRKLIFDAAKRRGAVFKTKADVDDMDSAIDEAIGAIVVTADRLIVGERGPEIVAMTGVVASELEPAPTDGRRRVSPRGIKLMHDFEGCELEAYPDPGSVDGNPWTIGWGSTGPGIQKGVKWTQAQADERFAADLNEKYGKAVDEMLGKTPTTQHQFDALVSLGYNIGLSALKRSTAMRLHKAGDYKGAARAFLMWNKNDGKVMRGLTRRRLAEADLYDDPDG